MDSRLYHVVIKEFRQLFRDPRMYRIALIMPILQLLVLGYIATTDLKNINTAVMDEDNSSLSRQYIRNIQNTGNFTIKYHVNSENEFKYLLDSGKASLALHFPRDFKKDLLAGKTANVQEIIDGSNSANAVIIQGYMDQINFTQSHAILARRLQKAGIDPGNLSLFDLETRVWYNPDMKSLYYMVPAIFAMILTMMTMILTVFAIVKEKEKGTIEQLLVTPLKTHELMLGKMAPPIIIALIDCVVAFLVATLWFRVPIHGSVFLLLSLALLYSLAGLGLGLFISTISRNQRQAMMTVMLLMSPQFILSGFIFPIASMPVFIQYFTLLLPLRYFLIIVRGIFLKGIGLRYLWNEIWPLMIFISVILLLSISRFNNKLD